MPPCPSSRQPHRSVQRHRTWLIATVSLFLAAACLLARELEIFEFLQTGPNQFRVDHQSNTTAYYILFSGDHPDTITTPVKLSLGEIGIGDFTVDPDPGEPRAFYEVRQIPINQALDLDSDGIDDVYELRNALDPLNAADAGLDPDGNGLTHLQEYQRAQAGPNTLTSAPSNGETGVAVTRETVLKFTSPLAAGAAINDANIFAENAGNVLPKRLHVSPDRTKVTLFYTNSLPPSARIRVTVFGSNLVDIYGETVDGNGDGVPGGTAVIEFDTLSLSDSANTGVSGRVFASELVMAPEGQMTVNEPLEGATITVDGRENELFAITDANGNFTLQPAPVGRFFVHIDGRTADAPVPAGSYYPFVGKTWTSVPGEVTNVGEVYLPLIPGDSLTPVSETEDTIITLPPSTLANFPDFTLFRLTVEAGALFKDDGTPGGMVGVQLVPPDRLPGQLPTGLNFPIVVTVQTDGATNFDVPAAVCFPNLPDPVTNETLAPGEETALWSFNHDTGQWEVVCSMTVSPDGTQVCSEPGCGILAPGWHGVNPGASVVGGNLVSPTSGIAGTDGRSPASPSPHEEATPNGNKPIVRSTISPYNPTVPGSVVNDDANIVGTGGQARERPDLSEPGHQTPTPFLHTKEGGPCPEPRPSTNPIYLFSGEKIEQVVDLRIAGRGFDFVWSRTYRSRLGLNTAQGNGWDHSYNVFLEVEGPDLRLANGNSRIDLYELQSNGTWIAREFFRVLKRNAGGTYTLTFADTSRWEFHPLDGSTLAGKLSAIVDRNGNRLTLTHDVFGRLTTITDTLGRDITLAYNSQGFIASVTDFSGRQVTYQYYESDEAGGPFGALKSATSPSVTGTPNGNDFPDGKTWSYTYSKDFTQPELNYNLLTKTDPKGQTTMVCTYAATTNPADLLFDRVIEQQWGNPGDVIGLTYSEQIPSMVNHFATTKTILNDRVGNVKELFFDSRNRLVIRREYTGRADPDLPTTEFSNRPMNPRRSGDPVFFETRHQYNADSQAIRKIFPNGNVREFIYEQDLTADPPPNARGNLREIRFLPGTHTPVGDQAMIIEKFEYDPRFNSCCGADFVTKHTDGRGNETLFEYDARGNRIKSTGRIPSIIAHFEYNNFGQLTARTLPDNGSNHHRRDTFTYHDSGPQMGYLASQTIDANGFALRSTYAYNMVGRLISRTDAKGNDTQIVRNALDQAVRILSRKVGDDVPALMAAASMAGGVRYERDFFYDENDNVVRIDIQNRDETGTLQANSHFTHTFAYEILNFLVSRTVEVDEAKSITTAFDYDANRNRILLRQGEAVNGNQPTNVVRTDYDERDLVFQTVRAPTDPRQSTTRHSYDANGNLLMSEEGLEDGAHTHTYLYDGYDRLLQEIDPMGNMVTRSYDPNHNIVRQVQHGEMQDLIGSGNNIRLAEQAREYDAMDRQVKTISEHFETATQNAIGDGQSIETTQWSDISQILAVTNDNNHTTTFTYDTANRRVTVTDAKGNTTTRMYDANSNVVNVTQLEKSDLGSPDETFTTTFIYDGLDRLIHSVDNIGNINESTFDSRNNLITVMDALRPNAGDPGNIVRHAYDGINRRLSTTRFLTSDGTGTGAPAGTIVTRQDYDDSDRLILLIDDNGHATQYQYDPLDRRIRGTHADGTFWTAIYNAHDTRAASMDPNGNTSTYTYDENDRLTRNDVNVAPGVSNDTTFENFQYDGLERLVMAQDNDSTITRTYDSLSHPTSETLNGVTMHTTHDGMGNQITCRYPGGRVITSTFDELERKQSITDGADFIAEDHFFGPGRVERRDFSNNTVSHSTFDGIRRITGKRYEFQNGGAPTTLDDWTFGWDGESNKTARHNQLPGGTEHTYDYDSIYRMIQSVSDGNTTQYALDGAHNRTLVTGGPNPGVYTQDNTAPDPADAQVNQYTGTPFDTRAYDDSGNLTMINPGQAMERTLTYDYKNRLVSHHDGITQTTYGYDALSRRIYKNVGGAITLYYYTGSQVCEERDGNGATTATYVYGRYVDDVLNMQRGGNDFFYHCDDKYNVTVVTDAAGDVVERYDYGDYGQPRMMNPAGGLIAQTTIGNPYLFTGRRFDSETGYYYYRTRYYDPETGRFITQDTIGNWSDPANLGNGLTYVMNNPFTFLDPMGTDIYIENTGAALGFHRRICVDTNYDPRNCKKLSWTSIKFCISFAAGEDADRVYEDNANPKTKEVQRFKTTCEEDKAILKRLKKLVKREMEYNLFLYNCRNFSHEQFDAIVKSVKFDRGAKANPLVIPPNTVVSGDCTSHDPKEVIRFDPLPTPSSAFQPSPSPSSVFQPPVDQGLSPEAIKEIKDFFDVE